MRARNPTATFTRSSALLITIAGTGCAAGSLIQQRAQRAAQDEARQIVEDEIQCTVDDAACTEDAEASGAEVVYVDETGQVMTDEAGEPIMDREQARARPGPMAADPSGAESPLTGAGALFFEDYSDVAVGQLPSRLEFIQGSWGVIESGERRYLRATSSGSVRIPLPEALPGRFTVEFDVSLGDEEGRIVVTPEPAFETPEPSFAGSAPIVGVEEAGVLLVGNVGPQAVTGHDHDFRIEGAARFRIVVNGESIAVHVGGRRVSGVPNAIFPRTDALYLAASGASEGRPTLIGPIRIGGS